MRQRKQREVAKENEFYMQLLQQALPQEEILENSEQIASQIDVQHREFSAVTTTFNGHNNNNLNNNKNAQTNSKNNHNIFNNTNGHVITSSNVPCSTNTSSHMSNGVNHLHNSNSHKNSNHRRSLDKDSTSNSKVSDQNFSNETKSSSSTTINHKNNSCSKDSRFNNDQKSEQIHQNGNNISTESTSSTIYTSSKSKLNHHNGSVHNFEVTENLSNNELATTENSLDRQKSGRKNRFRPKNVESKELNNQHSNESVTNCNISSASTYSSHVSQHQQTVPQICESCCRLEHDIKKMKQEISHLKQTENDLRQKHESNLNYKSCLQAKQKEYDELEKRYVQFFLNT